MDKGVAEKLVEELVKHPGVSVQNRDLFINDLVETDVPDSTRFCEELPDRRQIVTDSGRELYLSLRRVLRNRNAEHHRAGVLLQFYAGLVLALGGYSSDIMVKKLRADEGLVDMMARCEHPFSLLGKLETYDYGQPSKGTVVITKPILVIPDVRYIEPILNWEKANTTYEREVGPFRRSINPQSYLSS